MTTDYAVTTHSGRATTQSRLKMVFELVANPADWKARINATIPTAKLVELGVTFEEIEDAIAHFTGTLPFVQSVAGVTYAKAKGYRMGPAGDH